MSKDVPSIGDREAAAVYVAELSRDLALIARTTASTPSAISWKWHGLEAENAIRDANRQQ